MKQNNMYQYFIVLMLSLFIISCASTPLLDTPKKQLSSLDMQVQAVIISAYELTVAGVLQKDDVDPLIQQANSSMVLAWAAYGKGDMLELDNRMMMVNKLLLEVRAILVAKEGAK